MKRLSWNVRDEQGKVTRIRDEENEEKRRGLQVVKDQNS